MESAPLVGVLVTRSPLTVDTVTLGSETLTVEQLASRWLEDYPNPNTAEAYARDLLVWFGWCDSRRVSPLAAEHEHVAKFAGELAADEVDPLTGEVVKAGAAPTTVARSLAAVSSFYTWCVRRGAMPANPAKNVRRPKTTEEHVALTPALGRDDLTRLIAAATAPRDRALVLVLSVLGLRISEALALNLDDPRDERGHRTVVVRGKGGKTKTMPLPPMVVDALEQLAAAEGRTTGPVFLSTDTRKGQTITRRMSRHGATRALARLARRAGLHETPVHPHVMRATAITGALEAGAPLHVVQDMARHADPRTTQRYNRAREVLDGHAAYTVAGWIAAGTTA